MFRGEGEKIRRRWTDQSERGIRKKRGGLTIKDASDMLNKYLTKQQAGTWGCRHNTTPVRKLDMVPLLYTLLKLKL